MNTSYSSTKSYLIKKNNLSRKRVGGGGGGGTGVMFRH